MSASQLNKYLDFLVEDLLGEALRGGFDLRHFKNLPSPREQKEYAQEKLKLLNCGSERCSFALSSGKILKVPTYPDFKNFEQNESEINTYTKFGSEYVPKIYDFAPDYSWLIVEPARVFTGGWDLKDRTGIGLSVIGDFERFVKRTGQLSISWQDSAVPLKWNRFKEEQDKRTQWLEAPQIPEWDKLPPLGQQLVAKHHFLTQNGLIDITRADHWGWTSDGRLVCVDPGISIL